jgi:hypothetical protein
MRAVANDAPHFRLMLAACLAGAFVCLWMGFSVPERASDFNEFYSASKLAGSGHIYDWHRIQAIEQVHGDTIPFGRFPVYAVLFKPLALLPFAYARVAWLAINALALILFALLWPVARRDRLVMSLCWSCPAALLLSTGQDTGLYLFFVALGFRLLHSGRDFAAGLVLSLCAAKIHLALGIPVFLIAQRKWIAMSAGALSGVVQLAVSFAAEGRDWPAKLLHLASISEFSPAVQKMPNLFGLTFWLPYAGLMEACLAVAVLAAVWLISRRATLATGATAAIIGGLLVSHHAYVYDAVLLLPALALAWELPVFSERLPYWLLFLCTPIPYLALMKDRLAAIAQLSMSAFCLALLTVLAARCLRAHAGESRIATIDEGEARIELCS